jgi:3-hydroxyisobutyrate dehydrogenase-like beta-hydroxyacid dehydrogenase
MTTIGLIGVGLMGRGIGENLLKKGHQLIVLAHRKRQFVDELIALGASEAKTPRELAEKAEITLVCVTGTPQFLAIAEGDDGIYAAMRAGKTLIDCTTGKPAGTLAAVAEVETRGAAFADAPLARTPVEAREGRLNSMVGARPEVFAAIEPVLRCFCENIFHVGGPGAGAHLKLINNLIAMGHAALIAEAVVACKATGVDVTKLFEVVSKGGANSGIFQMIMKGYVESGSLEGMKFSLANAQKDLGYFVDMAMNAGLVAPMGAAVHNQLATARAVGFDEGLVGHLVAAALRINFGETGK